MDKITDNFSDSEFGQPARHGFPALAYPQQWIVQRLLPLCQQLEIIRRACGGKSVTILSGFRSPEYNRKIGGTRASQHMEGRAADIAVAGLSADEVRHVIGQLLNNGELPLVKGVGLYPNFTHVDIRPSPKLIVWQGGRLEN